MKKIVLLCLSGVLVNNLVISGSVEAGYKNPFDGELSSDFEAVIHKASYLLNGDEKKNSTGLPSPTRPSCALSHKAHAEQVELRRAAKNFEARRNSFKLVSTVIDPKNSNTYYNQDGHHQLIYNVNKSASDLGLTKEGCQDAKTTLSWLGDDLDDIDDYSKAANKPPSSASWLGMSAASSMSQLKNEALQAAASARLQRKMTYKSGKEIISAMATATKCLELAKKFVGPR